MKMKNSWTNMNKKILHLFYVHLEKRPLEKNVPGV